MKKLIQKSSKAEWLKSFNRATKKHPEKALLDNPDSPIKTGTNSFSYLSKGILKVVYYV